MFSFSVTSCNWGNIPVFENYYLFVIKLKVEYEGAAIYLNKNVQKK